MLTLKEMHQKTDVSKSKAATDNTPKKSLITSNGIKNLVTQLQDNVNKIGLLEKEINTLLETVSIEKHSRFSSELKELSDQFYSEEDELNDFLTREATVKSNIENDFNNLYAQLQKLFEIYRKFYILKLNLMVENIEDHFKLDGDIKDDKPILREVLHTVLLAVPEFNEYFKFKKREGDTDYRPPIKRLKFSDKTPETAMQSLTKNQEYIQSCRGQERLLIAQFTELSPTQFSQSFSQYSRDTFYSNSPSLRHIFLNEQKIIIILLRDFHSKRLNLHGFAIKQAMKNVVSYLRNRFLDFQNEAVLITGKGKHSAKGKNTIKDGIFSHLAKWTKGDKKLIKRYKENFHNQGEVDVEFHAPIEINYTNFEENLVNAINNREHRLKVKLPEKHTQAQLKDLSAKLTVQAMHSPLITASNLTIRTVDQEDGEYVKLFFMYSDKKEDLINSEMPHEEHRGFSQITINRDL